MANKGYGVCPACGAINPPGTSRERRPDGNTICGACKAKTPSRDWKIPNETARPDCESDRITVHDHYAAAAMQSLLAKYGAAQGETWVAKHAHRMADFMMKGRDGE